MAKREYIEQNTKWLKDKAKEDNIFHIYNEVYYKIIKSGSDEKIHPNTRSIVTVNYTGKTIDGKIFDSTKGETPLAIRLSDVIDGWIIALQKMSIGDIWEVYIPANMGYGKFSQPGIPGGSTLIFEIELLNIC